METIFYSSTTMLDKGPMSGLLCFLLGFSLIFWFLAKALGLSTESNLFAILLGQCIMGMDAGPTSPNNGLP